MRFVFFDNDTRLLFATAFDGDWDTYIDDFVAKIPDYLDIIDPRGKAGRAFASRSEGLPRQAPDHGGRLVRRLSGLTVAEIKRQQRIGKAVEEFLDKVG